MQKRWAHRTYAAHASNFRYGVLSVSFQSEFMHIVYAIHVVKELPVFRFAKIWNITRTNSYIT